MRGSAGTVDEDRHLLPEVRRFKHASQHSPSVSRSEDATMSMEELSSKHLPKSLARQTTPIIPVSPRKRRFAPAFVLSIYSFLLIISWVVTGILAFKPLNTSQWQTKWSVPNVWPCYYTDAITGYGFSCVGIENLLSEEQLGLNDRWRRAVSLIGSIMAVLAVPISSAICARAAVVYVQNRPDKFSISKTLALADRGWWDPVIAAELLRRRGRDKYLSRFLLIATGVSVLGAIVWPLRQILVTEDSARVVVRSGILPTILAYDADIAGLSQARSTDTIRSTRDTINLSGYWDSQPNLWQTPESQCNGTSAGGMVSCRSELHDKTDFTYMTHLPGESSFVSSVLNTANTGLFDGHGFRFNSSVKCTNVTDNEFPQPCVGFATSSSLTGQDDTDDGSSGMEFRLCAPGDLKRFPWNITRNRQDIEEEIYLQFNDAAVSFLSNQTASTSVTQKCTVQTTAGYFLLPNQDNTSFGPLLDNFDLSVSYDPKSAFTKEDGVMPDIPIADMVLGEAYPIPDVSDTPILGPLLTATVGIFGPSTFFSKRANATVSTSSKVRRQFPAEAENCEDGVPFYYLADGSPATHVYQPQASCASNDPSHYSEDLNSWLRDLFLKQHVSDPTLSVEDVFSIGAFYANKANLAQASLIPKYRRTLLTDPGVETKILNVHPAALVVLSAAVIAHICGLVALSYYTVKHPTWTETMDARAVLTLGSHLKSVDTASLLNLYTITKAHPVTENLFRPFEFRITAYGIEVDPKVCAQGWLTQEGAIRGTGRTFLETLRPWLVQEWKLQPCAHGCAFSVKLCTCHVEIRQSRRRVAPSKRIAPLPHVAVVRNVFFGLPQLPRYRLCVDDPLDRLCEVLLSE